MPVHPRPPSGHLPPVGNSRSAPSDSNTGDKVKKTDKSKKGRVLPESHQSNNSLPEKARKVASDSAAPAVNTRAVAIENYRNQLDKTISLQTQASFIDHIPDLKAFGDQPGAPEPDLDFAIVYQENGRLISVVPPDDDLKANPEKHRAIRAKLFGEVEQIENVYKEENRQSLFNQRVASEIYLEQCRQTLLETGATLPEATPETLFIPLDSLIQSRLSPSQPIDRETVNIKPDGFALGREISSSAESRPVRRETRIERPTKDHSGTFTLNAPVADRVRFITDEEMTLLDQGVNRLKNYLNDCYRAFRPADTDWLASTAIKIKELNPADCEKLAYSSKGHEVLKKFHVQIQTSSDSTYVPGDEMLVVRDLATGQLKLVRIGSFDGEDVGGGGFPGYSKTGPRRAEAFLKNRTLGSRRPYQHLRAGNAGNIEAWGCGFHSLQMAIFMATGIKIPFPVLVATIEKQLDQRDPESRDKVISWLNRSGYAFGPVVLQTLLGDTNRYKAPPFGRTYNGHILIGTEQNSPTAIKERRNFNRCDTQVISREAIDQHDFDKAATVMVGKDLYAFAVTRIRARDGSYQYLVYDPHNFHYQKDFFTNPSRGGLNVFSSKLAAFNYISAHKGGRKPQREFDGFYSFPDIILQDLQKNMLKVCEEWQRNAVATAT